MLKCWAENSIGEYIVCLSVCASCGPVCVCVICMLSFLYLYFLLRLSVCFCVIPYIILNWNRPSGRSWQCSWSQVGEGTTQRAWRRHKGHSTITETTAPIMADHVSLSFQEHSTKQQDTIHHSLSVHCYANPNIPITTRVWYIRICHWLNLPLIPTHWRVLVALFII